MGASERAGERKSMPAGRPAREPNSNELQQQLTFGRRGYNLLILCSPEVNKRASESERERERGALATLLANSEAGEVLIARGKTQRHRSGVNKQQQVAINLLALFVLVSPIRLPARLYGWLAGHLLARSCTHTCLFSSCPSARLACKKLN